MADFSWNIKIKGFGVFDESITETMKLNKSRIAIYAGNGKGKSCISRLFRASEENAPLLTDSMITKGKRSGSFSFVVRQEGRQDKTLTVSKTLNADAVVENDSGYLFHVFNSDYVREHLGDRNYNPDGQIEGYIIGKGNIDVSEKRKQLNEVAEQGSAKRKLLDNALQDARDHLQQIGVSTRITEFGELTIGNLLSSAVESDEYDAKLAEYDAMRNMPENVQAPVAPPFEAPPIFDDMRLLLETKYTRAEFSEEFLAEVAERRAFIAGGIALPHDKKCPFCHMDLGKDAQVLIHQYEEYLGSKESEVVSRIDTYQDNLMAFKTSYSQIRSKHLERQRFFDELKPAFTNLKEASLANVPTDEECAERIDALVTALGTKKGDITKPCATAPIDDVLAMFEHISKALNDSNAQIEELLNEVQNTSKKLTNLRRALCIETKKKLRSDYALLIDELNELIQAHKELEEQIRKDEANNRKNKRDEVASLFAGLIHEVFGNKYIFDEQNFAILFRATPLGGEAAQILSDGEKTVLAFCHYVASTVTLFNRTEDRDRLFFVIDDPISSLDFHYVYSIAQIIRNLSPLVANNPTRLMVLTHNSAFFNLLIRNKVVSKGYVLDSHGIAPCSKGTIAPYSEHLKDLVEVATQSKEISHTTGNSIRQVLESLWRFEDPATDDFGAYLASERCQDLNSCEYIFTLCNDLSHGASESDRSQPPDNESVRQAAFAVVKHIQDFYPGQLAALGIELRNETPYSTPETQEVVDG